MANFRKSKSNIVIFGGGNIASNIDLQGSNKYPKSHCGAFSKNKFFNIYCIIEPNLKLHKFLRKWKPEFILGNFNEFIKIQINIDVVVIASNTSNHFLNIKQAFNINPKIILCEKPLASNINEINQIYKLCKKKNIKLIINYNRRFDTSMIKLKKDIYSKKYGILRSLNCTYNKGLLNNGSHLLDLLIYFFNNLNLGYAGKEIIDYHKNDPSVPFVLYHKEIPIFTNVASSKDYYIFNIIIHFSKYVIIINDGGNRIEYQKAVKSKELKNIKILKNLKDVKTNYQKSMVNIVNYIQGMLLNKNTFKFLPSTKNDTYKLFKIINKIKKYKYENQI